MADYRAIVPEPGRVELEEIEIDAPGPGQALLKSERTLISTGTELTAVTGDFPPVSRWADYIRYPFPLGYSSVATVEAVGPDVKEVSVGDRVASFAPHATRTVYPVSALRPIPDGVDSESASFATLAEIALNGVRRGRVAFGESVAVVGAGLLGGLAALFCRKAGAWPVILIDTAERRLSLVGELARAETVAGTVDAALEPVRRLTAGRLADAVFEVTGHPLAIPGCLRLARDLGRIVLLGSSRGPVTIDLHDDAHTRGLELIGAHNSTHPRAETPHTPWTQARHVQLFFEWQAAGEIDVRPLITHRYGWRDTPAAYAMLLADRSSALGVVLDWSR